MQNYVVRHIVLVAKVREELTARKGAIARRLLRSCRLREPEAVKHNVDGSALHVFQLWRRIDTYEIT